MVASDRNREELEPRVPPSGATAEMQLQAKWCFPPHLSPSPNSNEERKPRKWVFVLFTKAWGFEGRVQHGVQGMGTAGQQVGRGWTPGPLSGHSAAFSTFLYSTVSSTPSARTQLSPAPGLASESDQSPCSAGLPSLTSTNIDLGVQGSYTWHCQII